MVMYISFKETINWKIYTNVDQFFRYLDSLISDDGYCTKEIRSRIIEMAKKVLMKKKKLFTR